MTFSRSLAEHILDRAGPDYSLDRISLRLGEELGPYSESPSGLYALVSRAKGKILRVTLHKECSWFMQDESRAVCGVWLE